jgi:lipopolysaccharide/colanic/teichoic acid biosynthesis glycosyltransferase
VLFSPIDQTQFEQLVAHCAERGLSVRMMVEVPSAALGTWQMDKWAENTFFISLSALPQDPLQLAAKRIIDVAGALVGLSLFALTWAIYGRRLKRESHGTVLFKQRRVGMNGRRFLLHKFRTMYHDSEHRKEGLHTLNQMRGPMFKLKDDPRITPTGRKLRRRHLDELPQFWNVLKGEMSLVGTRPPTEDEVAQYQDWHHRRLSIKPGITGLWQLNGNHRVRDFEEVVKLDCEYIDKWSLWLDLRIMVGTISKVMRADGW